MTTRAIVAAPIDGAADHPTPAHTQRVFLAGNQLPQHWADRADFVLLDTDFGHGHHFIHTWRAWQAHSERCERLHVVALLHQPPTRADLARAHAACTAPQLAQALVEAWPTLTPNLHALCFDDGRVRLLLAFGEPGRLLRELRCSVDAFFLSGNTACDSHFAQALARRAAPGASLASERADTELHQHLHSAGFVVQTQRNPHQQPFTTAHWAPRFTPRGLPMPRPRPAADVMVVGAGLAGAAVAHALHQRGWQVQVWDQLVRPAMAASGNPAGIFHGSLHAQDGPHARLLRAAALHATRCLQPLLHSGAVVGAAHGLLRLSSSPLHRMQSLLHEQGLPPEFVSALSAHEATRLAGVPLTGPAWLYPGGGWLAPALLVEHWLDGIDFFGSSAVAGVRPGGPGWLLLNAAGAVLAEAAVVVLANAEGAQRLLAPWGAAGWPLQRTRGQITGFVQVPGSAALALPVAGDGYALPLPAGGLLCGASSAENDDEPGLRDTDHAHNLTRLARLCGLQPAPGQAVSGRVAWRLQSNDKLPIAGAVPIWPSGIQQNDAQDSAQPIDQARRLPRVPGLFVCTALGGRGITWAPLLGELLAAQICGTPLPLEQSLLDAVDPGRWMVRAVRAGRDS